MVTGVRAAGIGREAWSKSARGGLEATLIGRWVGPEGQRLCEKGPLGRRIPENLAISTNREYVFSTFTCN